MSEDRTIRERVATIEAKHMQLDKLISDYDGLEMIHHSLISELSKTNASIKELSLKVDDMSPIIKEVMLVKGYGSISWRILKWVGGITVGIIAMWDKIKHFTHYIFN